MKSPGRSDINAPGRAVYRFVPRGEDDARTTLSQTRTRKHTHTPARTLSTVSKRARAGREIHRNSTENNDTGVVMEEIYDRL